MQSAVTANLLRKFYNKLISHTYIPHSMLKGHIRPTVKNSSGNKTDSKNYRPVMNSSNFLKVIEYLLLPHLEKHLLIHKNRFAYRPATGCIDAITVLKETVIYYKSQRSMIYCAVVDLSKVYDKISTSLLCDKIRETDLPGQVIAFINFMGKNTFVCTSYGGQLSNEMNVRDGVGQRGISSGILLSLNLNEVMTETYKLQAGCTLNCSEVSILGYADDLVLVAPAAQAFTILLSAHNSILSTLLLQVNVLKSCNIVLRHSNKKVSTSLTMNNQPLRQVMENIPT